MLTLHCTKKLSIKLPVNAQGCLPVSSPLVAANDSALHGSADENPLSNWHANLLTLQRRNCLLLMHDQTRFPLLLTCLVKKDLANLNQLFEDALLNTLLKMGASQTQFETAAKYIGAIQVDNQCDRSVQGTMNQMAQSPCTVKGQKDCIWPEKAMLALLDTI